MPLQGAALKNGGCEHAVVEENTHGVHNLENVLLAADVAELGGIVVGKRFRRLILCVRMAYATLFLIAAVSAIVYFDGGWMRASLVCCVLSLTGFFCMDYFDQILETRRCAI